MSRFIYTRNLYFSPLEPLQLRLHSKRKNPAILNRKSFNNGEIIFLFLLKTRIILDVKTFGVSLKRNYCSFVHCFAFFVLLVLRQ